MNGILELLAAWFGMKWEESLSKDYSEDPVYKQNVQKLIERNREFEDAKNDSHS
jgi:hypothetical protein